MDFIHVTSYYGQFLKQFHQRHEVNTDYATQYRTLMDQKFAYADFLVEHMKKKHGLESMAIVRNADSLQQAWAKENRLKPSDEVFIHQLRAYQPRYLFLQDALNYSVAQLDHIRKEIPSIEVLAGHHFSTFNHSQIEAFKRFDLMLVGSEGFQELFSSHGIQTTLIRHSFHPPLAEIAGQDEAHNDILVSGMLSNKPGFHQKRVALVEEMFRHNIPVKLMAILDSRLLSLKLGGYSRVIRKHNTGEALFGIDMYREISAHAISFNMHADIAGHHAGNMRMFEVTGMGRLLLTDDKPNMNQLFEVGKEVLTYRNPGECIEQILWALAHPDEAAAIAAAGQSRTLKDYSTTLMADRLHGLMTNSG